MSSYVLKILAPDEKVIYFGTLHWVVYAQGMVFTVAGGLVGYFAPYITGYVFGPKMAEFMTKPLAWASLVVVMMGFAMLLGAYVRQVSTELVVTNQRIIAKYGFISRATFEIMISRVTGANFDQTIMGRILGYGTIIVRGAGGDISPIDLISNPAAFHTAVMASFEKKPGA